MTTRFIKKGFNAAFVYDCTDEASFREVKNWIKLYDEKVGVSGHKVLLATKCDRVQDIQDKIESIKQGMELAKESGMMFFETSAKVGHNVEEAFKYLALKSFKEETEKQKKPAKEQPEMPKKESCNI